ncbi:F-box domain-containing protein [Rutstroemia sp. NJR-2017a BBW]|nr:F-box domain-containing protein [Rutstroemia sp. NJR-2017a BBW]
MFVRHTQRELEDSIANAPFGSNALFATNELRQAPHWIVLPQIFILNNDGLKQIHRTYLILNMGGKIATQDALFTYPTRSTGCTAINDTEDNHPATPTLEPSPKMANINQIPTNSRSPSTTFVPSSILNGSRRTMTPDRARKANQIGIFINPNYKGEITDFDLRNAMCPSEENCAVRIHRIDSNATLYEIFQIITHGKVLSFHLNPAVEGIHAYAAARLVFVTRAAAESFISDARSPQGLHVRGQRIEALWNRDKVSTTEGRYEKMSRVIRIKGPAQEISVGILTRFFKTQFAFQLVSSKEWVEHDGYKVVELAFSSIRAQSESAVKCFRQRRPMRCFVFGTVEIRAVLLKYRHLIGGIFDRLGVGARGC